MHKKGTQRRQSKSGKKTVKKKMMCGGGSGSGRQRSPDRRTCDICGQLLFSDALLNPNNYDMAPVRIGICNKSFHSRCLHSLPVVRTINGKQYRKCPNSNELFTEPF